MSLRDDLNAISWFMKAGSFHEMGSPEDADMRPPTGVAPFGGLDLLIAKNPSQ
jgi:hypothetical protein